MADKADNGYNFPHEFLQSGQGWIQKQVNGETIRIQNTSTYRMTRYVKQGVAVPLYLTTSQSTSSASPQHTYQRWYNYDTELPLENGENCDLSKGNFNVLKYKNGLVMGSHIKGGANDANHYAGFNFWGILPTSLERLNIGADITSYKDWSYVNNGANVSAANAGNMTEPSLTLRHIYELVDAKVMADSLVKMTGDKWYEEHVIHFPRISTLVFQSASDGSNFVPLNMELENYWFYTGDGIRSNDNLQNLINNNYVEVSYEKSSTEMTITGTNFREAPNTNANGVTNSTLRRRRLIGFQYNTVPANSRLTIKVRTKDPNNSSRKYNVAKFTIIFDDNSEVVPYMDVVPDDGAKHSRSTQVLREACHGADPVARIDFDYPHTPAYRSPAGGIHFYSTDPGVGDYTHSSALPIAFEKTSYAYSPIANAGTLFNYCVWGSYAIVDYVNQSGTLYPASTVTNDDIDKNSSNEGFLYIDASDMPGTVASVPFEGTFCMGTKMMCSGWMSSVANNVPGSVILKVIGKRPDNTEKEIYAFCPGQIGKSYRSAGAAGITKASGDMVWQQFYFEFFLNEPCVSYELRVENNCVSTSGGDYFLDDIWVFAQLPQVGPEMTTPLCGGSMDVVQLETNFESLLLSKGISEATTAADAQHGYLSFIYIDWDKFLQLFKDGLAGMGITISGDELQERINSGYYDVDEYRTIYHNAFSESILRDTINNVPKVVYGNFEWSSYFADHPAFSFAAMALDKESTVYGLTSSNGQRRLIFNGSMGYDDWEFYHNYALLTTLRTDPMTDAEFEYPTWISDLLFNVLNECSNRSILWFVPKIEILGTVGGVSIDKLEFCENTSQTFAMELTGYTRTDGYTDEDGVHHPGDPVVMSDVYFDWWLGVPKTATTDSIPATVENYMKQYIDDGSERIYLYDAVRCFRFRNPDITNLYSPAIKFGQNPLYPDIPAFTTRMLDYLRSLANPSDGSKPQLYIHTKIVDVDITEENIVNEIYLGDTIKYVKFVAIPIEANLNSSASNFVYICAEPQPFKVKVSSHAPNVTVGFSEKAYPNSLGTLSVRISKSQFEKLVDRGNGYTKLHIPLRGVDVVHPHCLGVKAPDSDDNIALRNVLVVNSTDSLMQDKIMQHLADPANNMLPPTIGKVDYLLGRYETKWAEAGRPEEQRLLKIHFNNDFQVREGYSYTLRYFFIEEGNDNSDYTLACEGNGDILLKIVPDYEVWTGGADNVDWSNDENWRRADYDELYAGNGTHLKDKYMPNGEVGVTTTPEKYNYVTDVDRERMQGFAPLYCTNILMMTKEKNDASSLYDDGDEVVDGEKTGFPALRSTSSPLIRYDFQAHEWVQDSIDAHTGAYAYRAKGDMITELYKTNVCDSIAFQSETELINSYYLNYNKAWVEFSLPKNKWHLVSSPLQGTISGEWYAPTWSGRQETTYYEPINFDVTDHIAMTGYSGEYPSGLDYDRFAPAVYQRQWDKAKAVLYERGAIWSADDASQTDSLGYAEEGDWSAAADSVAFSWDSSNADEYLNRMVYKPFGVSKINVAVRGSWSGAHNDHTVPYDNGGFSVMPINNLKDHNDDAVNTIFRLPKDDQYYDIWDWGKGYTQDRRVRIYIDDGRRPMLEGATETNTVTLNNRGRLRSDYFASPTSDEISSHIGSTSAEDLAKYDLDKNGVIDADDVSMKTVYEVTLKNEGEGSMGYFLASNPFICGLDMEKFFKLNTDVVYPYYLVLKGSDVDPQNSSLTDTYLSSQPSGTTWKWTDMNFSGISDGTDLLGRKVVPPRYAFFLKKKGTKNLNELTLKYTPDMMVKTPRDESGKPNGIRSYLSIMAERDGDMSEATVMMSQNASNKFLPEEDLETFIVSDISSNVPVIYTLTGRLATSVNRLHDFTVLPIGIESNSDKPAKVTFQGVENLGDSLMLYDVQTEELLPLKSGTTTQMPGRTQNRFFIVQGIDLKKAIEETTLQIHADDGIVTVATSTNEPISEVHAYDAGGREVFVANPNSSEFRFKLPKGIFIIKASTETVRKVKKVGN